MAKKIDKYSIATKNERVYGDKFKLLIGATVVLTYKKSEKWEDTYAWFETRIGKKVKLSVEKQPVMGKIKKVDVADKIVVYVEILEVLKK